MKVIITALFKTMVDYLHTMYKKEWCGVPVFRVLSGDNINKDLVVQFEALYLMDLGNETFTNWENKDYKSEIKKLYGNDDFDNMYIPNTNALIHTHHGMGIGTTFSGTDMQELRDKYNKTLYYISLIVHHTTEWNAQIVWEELVKFNIPITRSVKSSVTGELLTLSAIKTTTQSEMVQYKMSVEMPENIIVELPQHFIDRFNELNNKKVPISQSYYDNELPLGFSRMPVRNNRAVWINDEYVIPNKQSIKSDVYSIEALDTMERFLCELLDSISLHQGLDSFNRVFIKGEDNIGIKEALKSFIEDYHSWYNPFFNKEGASDYTTEDIVKSYPLAVEVLKGYENRTLFAKLLIKVLSNDKRIK